MLGKGRPMTLIELACMYLDEGFSIIPLQPRNKHPPEGFRWKEYQSRRPTEEEIYQWFGDGEEHNIGIVTGAVSGLCVVDLDSESAVEFSKLHGFPRTPMVKTGKGYHLYYNYTEGVRNFQNRHDLPDIDLRGDGGYVVAPPSVHESGKQYLFPEGYSLFDLPLADLPEILLSLQEQKPPPSDLVKGVSKGSRNDSLARLCGSWIRHGLSLVECVENARIWNARNAPPLTDGEIERTIKSIWEKNGSGESTKKKAEPVKGYPITVAQMLAEDVPDPEPFIKDLIHREELIILSGPTKLGKTILCSNIGLSMACGRSWHGFEIPRPMRVLYSQQEVSYPWFRKRLIRMIEHLENDEYDLLKDNFLQATTKGLLLDRGDHERIVRSWIEGLKPDLIVLDPLFTYHTGNENSTQEMNRLIRVLQRIIQDYKVTIVLVHHHGKPSAVDLSGSERHRGSSVIGGAADGNLIFQRVSKTRYELAGSPDQYGELSFEMRNVRAPEPMILRRNEETLWLDRVKPDSVAKVTAGDVVRYLLENGPTMRKVLIKEMMELHEASEITVKRAIMKTEDVASRKMKGKGGPVELYLEPSDKPVSDDGF